ncbi:MAG: oligosaccharide flippase family protein [Chlorobiaceae bacterium]
MSRNTVIAGQAGVSFAGFLFGQATRFAFNLLVARLLGLDALGIYAIAVAVIQIAEVLALLGLDSGLLRFINLHNGDPERQKGVIGSALKSALFFSFAIVLLVLLFSGPIAAAFNGGRLLQLTLCCYAASIPFSAATVLFGHAIQGFKKLEPKIIATQVVSPLLLLLFTTLFRYTAGRDEALLLPYLLSAAAVFFWIRPRLAAFTGIGTDDLLHAPLDRAMLSYALPFMAVSLLSMTAHWLDVMMLGIFTDTATVGLYHPAARTAGMIRSVLLAFSGIAAPMIAELHASRRNDEIGRIFKMVTRWIVVATIPPALLFMLLPEPVLGLFGARFSAGTSALVLLTGAAFLQATLGLSSTVLAMTGFGRLSLFNALGALACQIALNLFLIPKMGINGAALATLLVFLLLSTARLLEIGHFLHIHPFARSLWKPLLSALASAGLLLFARPWLLQLTPAAGVAAGALLLLFSHLSVMLFLKLEDEEREIIIKYVPFLGKELKR